MSTAAPTWGLRVVLAILVLVGGITGAAPTLDADPIETERFFVERINELRGREGLAPLVVDPELTAAATAWAATMAANDRLAHADDISVGVTAPWILLGENVGVHDVAAPDELFDAFVQSPTHYENLIDPEFRFVGVGVVETDEGRLWTTHRFMAVADLDDTAAEATTTSTWGQRLVIVLTWWFDWVRAQLRSP